MRNQKKIVYENIAVIAIYMPDAEAILFEENSTFMLEQYQKFLAGCTEIMQREDNCMDIIIYNNFMCGIFNNSCSTTIRDVMVAAGKMGDLAGEISRKTEECYPDKLFWGIGVAAGMAAMIPIFNSSQMWQKVVWIGPVLNKAFSMARMSICDGSRQVFTADMQTIYYDEASMQ